MFPVLSYVSLGCCAILGYFVVLYRRELARRRRTPTIKLDPLPKAVDPKRIEEFLKQLRGVAAAGIEFGQDPSWATKTAAELAAGGSQAPAILGAAMQLLEVNKRLLAELAAKPSKTDESGDSGARALHEEIGRRLAELRRQKTPFCLLCLGIDQPKHRERQHGPAAGRDVAREIAAVVVKVLRGMDVVVPQAGERIAAVLPGVRLANAEQAAKRLRNAIAKHRFGTGDQKVQATVGIGMAEAKTDEDSQGLVRRADRALHAALESGRGRIYLDNGQADNPVRPVLRQSRRYPMGTVQRIAPYTDGLSPERAAFEDVLCTDLSPGGFACLLDQRPNYRRLIVELGTRDDPKYMIAVVKSCVSVDSEAGRGFRVGCMFTGRLDPDGTAAPCPPEQETPATCEVAAPTAGSP